MSNFRKQFKQGDDYCDIRADYRSLISIGTTIERRGNGGPAAAGLLPERRRPAVHAHVLALPRHLRMGDRPTDAPDEGGGALLPFAISGDGRAAFERRAKRTAVGHVAVFPGNAGNAAFAPAGGQKDQ